MFLQDIVGNKAHDVSTSGPSAFRLKAHPGAVYEPSLDRGRPVLHGPLAANQLITEVSVITEVQLCVCS